ADGAGPLQEKASFQRPETGEWKTQLAPAVRALKRAEQWSFRRSFLASAAEAVSYLGLEEWTLFKEGLSDAFPAEPDIRLTEEPFFAWLMEQKGTEKPESPEGMSREKNGLIQALAEQSVPDRIFELMRVLGKHWKKAGSLPLICRQPVRKGLRTTDTQGTGSRRRRGRKKTMKTPRKHSGAGSSSGSGSFQLMAGGYSLRNLKKVMGKRV
ncbi:MAG: hypothetical protein ACLU8D_13305, partial [Enterocloster sp.]